MTSLLFSLRRAVVVAVVFAAFSGFALADSITGTVTNKTTNKPAAGDDVVLIRLAQGMQEASRTKTDAKGRFTLEVPDGNSGMHLVRVTHDKANYFRPAPPGTQSVEVEVFTAAPKVEGISSEANVMRLQTDESGKSLHVVENFFVKNESNPPKTQFSDRAFEFFLPEGAVVEGSAALGPGGMPVQASPVPLGDPNHFAFIFPIRPGETRFQITYHLPYNGSFTVLAADGDADRHDCGDDAEEHEVRRWASDTVFAGDGRDYGADVRGAECGSVAGVGLYRVGKRTVAEGFTGSGYGWFRWSSRYFVTGWRHIGCS